MSICTVVVTYNRKKQLLECLQSLLLSAEYIQKIVVVDNASSDGSFEYISQFGFLDSRKIEWLRLSENGGGAGGFYHGIDYALKHGYDYVWLMDDDGLPLGNCLQKLLENVQDSEVIGPVVIDQRTSSKNAKLSFGFRLPKTKLVVEKYSDFCNLFPVNCEGVVFAFNGTLIPISIVRKVGLPIKEYFIWGDETEFILRIKKNGYKIRTITNAFFYHPKSNTSAVPMFFGLIKYNVPTSDLKQYCFVRNTLKTYSEYYSKAYAFLFLCKVCWFNLFTKFNLHNLRIIFLAIKDLYKNDFSKHTRYL